MAQTLLFVSNQQNIVSSLQLAGKQSGYITLSADHANDALQIMNNRNIDAVICDAMLADIDGYHLCYKIRKTEKLKAIPVVICSYQGNHTEAQMARDLGADIFVTNTTNAQVIVDHVTSIFNHPQHFTNRLNPKSLSTEAMLRYNEQLITQLEKQNDELRKTKSDNERLIKILTEAQQIAHIGSWELNLDTLETNWSDEIFRILGTTASETNPSLHSFLSFVHPDEREKIKTIIEASLKQHNPIQFNCHLLRKDGTIRQVYCYAGFTYNIEGKAIRTYGVTHDITEKLKAEKEVLELNTVLEQRVTQRTEALLDANQQLESFAYSVSHDLRVPLRSVFQFSQLLLKKNGKQLDADGNELLQFIIASATKMQTLISDLLTFSRLDKNSIESVDIDMNELVKCTWNSLTASMDNIPEFKADILPAIKADRAMITQVLVNFLNNAIKYSSHNINPRIEVGTINGTPTPTFYIKDNGVGFDMAHYDKLFAVFQRLHSSSEFEGTGVGLAIIKRIIDKHNGKVWAESEPGKGATFYFSLPQ